MPNHRFSRIEDALQYDPLTGILRWKNTNGIAGREDPRGYRLIQFKRKLYLAHRIAWFLSYGHWPASDIDHINRNRRDNRILNLRVVTRGQNNLNGIAMRTSKTGLRGVHYSKKSGKYVAQITYAGHVHTLGSWHTPQEAYTAYCDAVLRLSGTARTP